MPSQRSNHTQPSSAPAMSSDEATGMYKLHLRLLLGKKQIRACVLPQTMEEFQQLRTSRNATTDHKALHEVRKRYKMDSESSSGITSLLASEALLFSLKEAVNASGSELDEDLCRAYSGSTQATMVDCPAAVDDQQRRPLQEVWRRSKKAIEEARKNCKDARLLFDTSSLEVVDVRTKKKITIASESLENSVGL